ncbi:MAG: tryptophan 7-halogenase, partial [Steroidobacteraceae bacterium]
RNRKHNSASMYAHFSGAQRYPDQRAGNISIYWFEHGWLWFIPLVDGTASVGAVVWPAYMKERHLPLEQFFMYTIAKSAPLAARLQHAQLVSPVEATGNYSYAASHSYGNRYLMVGDAYAFVDPVFSSGVWLAMNGAASAADAVDTFLRHPAKARTAMREYDRVTRLGPRVFSWFIYRITSPAMRDLFMNPRELFGVRSAVLSVLAGDIFGKTPIWKSLRVFKTIYMLTSVVNLRRTIAGWRDRAVNIRPVASQPAIRLERLSQGELQARPESWWQGVLGVVSFGQPLQVPAGLDIPNNLVHLPQLAPAQPACEVWQATGALLSGQRGALRFRSGADVLFGSLVLDERATPLHEVTSAGYAEIFAALDSLGFPHLLRVWNYFADINGATPRGERYHEFNTARRQAFVSAGRAIEAQVPAACALGSAAGSPLLIYFIASKTAGHALENPRQLSAYRYPAEYGPDSPTFSRAMVSTALSGSCLFTSGTASILGHQTMHAGDVAAQTRESIANILELVAEANRVRGARRHAIEEMQFKVYVRHARDLDVVRQQIALHLPPRCPITFLQADVCRADLLVEIEAVGDATPGNRPARE